MWMRNIDIPLEKKVATSGKKKESKLVVDFGLIEPIRIYPSR